MNISSQKLSLYLALTKPRITNLVLVTTVLGFFLGGKGIQSWQLLAWTLVGTALSCGGSSVLNMLLERDIDLKMERTRMRPLVTGEISLPNALAFGVLLVLGGTLLLVWKVNTLTGFLALLTAFLYVLVYTPLKRVTWLNTLIGSIPGALPPVGGWVAATGSAGLGAWVLFAIMFVWQQPHFYAIAWMYRDDYARGGLKMLPVVEPDGESTFSQIILYSVVLIPVAIMPSFIGLAGEVYFFGAFFLSIALLFPGFKLASTKSVADARKLLKATVMYLPAILALIVLDAGTHIPRVVAAL